MPVPVHFTKLDTLSFLGEEGKEYVKQLEEALHLMLQAQTLGSIMRFDISEQALDFIKNQFFMEETF